MKTFSKLLFLAAALICFSCGDIVNPQTNYCECKVKEKGWDIAGYWLVFDCPEKIRHKSYVGHGYWRNAEKGEVFNCN